MRILKALLGAVGITVVSCILLTITNGKPNMDRLATNVAEMFIVSFVVLLMYVGKGEKKS